MTRLIGLRWRMTVTDREVAAILTGLRLLQEAGDRSAVLSPALQDIVSDGGRLAPLDADELDQLAERINTGGVRVVR
jgi:hypothetical protein